MSANNVYRDSKNYLTMQGIANLKGQSQKNPQAARHEVSQQFETLLVQMLLKSMREANKALIENKESDSSSDLYQDLFDKQVAMSITGEGLGLGKAIEHYIGQLDPLPLDQKNPIDSVKINHSPEPLVNPPNQGTHKDEPDAFPDEWEFVKSLWGHAKKAAAELGIDPKLLLAQAALETGWGKKIIAQREKGNSFNIFNIKADSSWNKQTVNVNTLEEKDGIMAKENAFFRAYTSYAESFDDYVHFIKSNPRYQHALKEAGNPENYIHSLQKANYATDSNYSNKIMEIYKGERLNNLFQKAELI